MRMSADNYTPFIVVLLGKSGNGKSATGNTLLEVYRFEEGKHATSETHSLINFSVNPKDYPWTLKVFDTPGLTDTEDDDPYTNLKTFVENMDKLMGLCKKGDNGITAFILVFNITNRFTQEDRESIETYKKIFGEEFLSKHCILAFSYGDLIQEELDDWIRNQTGSIRQLLNTFKNRIVLVCNKDIEQKRTESRTRIVSAIESLREAYSEYYVYDDYIQHRSVRYKMLLELELPEVDKLYQEMLEEIQRNAKNMSKEEIRNKIAILKNKVEEKDNGTKLLSKHIKAIEDEQAKYPNCTIF